MKRTGKKRERRKKILLFAGFFVLALALGLELWRRQTEEDYCCEDVVCTPNSPISREERIRRECLSDYEDRLQNLEKGDILLTPCSHTFGWRNGHAAIVIDGEQELTLESVVLGSPASVQSVSKWRKYPGVLVLRLKDATEEERAAIADFALEWMEGVNYGFSQDFVENVWYRKSRNTETSAVSNTHCAHLVWWTYQSFGYDIDGDGGIFVTPKDISLSPLLETIEAYDVDNW